MYGQQHGPCSYLSPFSLSPPPLFFPWHSQKGPRYPPVKTVARVTLHIHSYCTQLFVRSDPLCRFLPPIIKLAYPRNSSLPYSTRLNGLPTYQLTTTTTDTCLIYLPTTIDNLVLLSSHFSSILPGDCLVLPVAACDWKETSVSTQVNWYLAWLVHRQKMLLETLFCCT